jgi:hypothetical protein
MTSTRDQANHIGKLHQFRGNQSDRPIYTYISPDNFNYH